MEIKINLDMKEIEESYSKKMLEQVWNKLAMRLHSLILRNIQRGVNADGKPMQNYSKSYLKQRLKKGLTSSVNLQWHSDMFRNITFIANDKGLSLLIPNDKHNQKAKWLNGHKNWHFFEWGSTLIKDLEQYIKKEFQK